MRIIANQVLKRQHFAKPPLSSATIQPLNTVEVICYTLMNVGEFISAQFPFGWRSSRTPFAVMSLHG